MQHPTCMNIRIRSTRDAHIIFHAVSLNVLPIISRRLDADERAALRSGCVYAWEERGPHTEVTGLGIERFTEGRRWGPSRVRDEFLFYYEKSPPGHLRDKENPMLEERLRKHWDPLVKQTYSVWVEGPRGRRKWHLTAYFTQATVDRLQTVDDFPELANVEVPPGKYISTRLGKPRRPEDASSSTTNNGYSTSSVHDVFRPANMTATRTYAPFPLPLPYQVTPQSHHVPQQQQHEPQPHQQPMPTAQPPNGFDSHHQQAGRSMHAPSEPSRHYYGATPAHHPRYPDNPLTLPPIHALASVPGAPSADRHFAEQPHSHPLAYTLRPEHPSQSYYMGYPLPPPEHHRAVMQLPTPTSSSSQYSSPTYSPHEHPNNFASYDGPRSMSYSSSNTSGSVPPLQSYHDSIAQPYSNPPYYTQNRRPPPLTIPSQLRTIPPSPSDPRSPGEASGSSPYRPTLTLPPHLANRLSPPISDARDEHEDDFSPPPSPRSAVSSTSVPGGKQLNLAPLRTLVRAQAHPYRRDKFDDKALMAFSGRKISE